MSRVAGRRVSCTSAVPSCRAGGTCSTTQHRRMPSRPTQSPRPLASELAADEFPTGLVIYRPPSVHGADRRVTDAITRIAWSRSALGRWSGESSVSSGAHPERGRCHRLPRGLSAAPPASGHPPVGGHDDIVAPGMLWAAVRHTSFPERVARTSYRVLTRCRSGRATPRADSPASRDALVRTGAGRQLAHPARVGGARRTRGVDSPATSVTARPKREVASSAWPVRAGSASPGAALVSTTIPMTLRHFYGELVAIMRRDGYDVTLVSSSGPHLDAAVLETGLRAQVIEMSRDVALHRDLRAWLQWHRVISARRRPAVVVAGTPKAALLAMTAAAMCRVPRRVYLCGGLRLEGSSGVLRRVLVLDGALGHGSGHRGHGQLLDPEGGGAVQPSRLVREAAPDDPGQHPRRKRRITSPPRRRIPTCESSTASSRTLPFSALSARLTHDKGIDTLIDAASALARSGARIPPSGRRSRRTSPIPKHMSRG